MDLAYNLSGDWFLGVSTPSDRYTCRYRRAYHRRLRVPTSHDSTSARFCAETLDCRRCCPCCLKPLHAHRISPRMDAGRRVHPDCRCMLHAGFPMVTTKQLERASYACTCWRWNTDLCMAGRGHGARDRTKDYHRPHWHDVLYWRCNMAVYQCSQKTANF